MAGAGKLRRDAGVAAEAAGGAGASLADGFAILRRAGAFALSAPLAETLVAARLLTRAGIAAPDGPLAAAELKRWKAAC